MVAVALAALVLAAPAELPFFTRFAAATLEGGTRNEALSPHSAEVVLDMIRLGAHGETGARFLENLGRTPETSAAARHGQIVGSGRFPAEVLSVSSFWHAPVARVKPGYTDTLRRRFESQIFPVTRFGPEQRNAINGWVYEATHGKIARLVEELDPGTQFVAVNALYFKARWRSNFSPNATREEGFRREDGQVVPVQMMRSTPLLSISSEDGYEAALMDYSDRTFTMMFVLPPADVPANDALRSMTSERFRTLLRQEQEPKRVRMELPRVRIESRFDLVRPLEKGGFGRLLRTGDFREIGDGYRRGLGPLESAQAVVIEWDEYGTEAAASMYLGVASAGSGKVRFDRPFLFYLVHVPTETVLFSGVVHDPTAPAGRPARS
jgi:serpin B